MFSFSKVKASHGTNHPAARAGLTGRATMAVDEVKTERFTALFAQKPLMLGNQVKI